MSIPIRRRTPFLCGVAALLCLPAGGDGLQAQTAAGAGGPDYPRTRGYVTLKYGRAWLTQTRIDDRLKFGGSVGRELIAVSFGANLGRRFALEFALDGQEPPVLASGRGTAGEYAVSTGILQGRYRWPMGGDRMTVYALAGAGAGFNEFNDAGRPGPAGANFQGRGFEFAWSLGGGFEYFVYDNVAVGAEARFVNTSADVRIDGADDRLQLDALSLGATLRMHYPGLPFQPDRTSGGTPWWQIDARGVQPYMMLRSGVPFLLSRRLTQDIELPPDDREAVVNLTFGADVNRHLGFEVAVDYHEINVGVVDGNKVGELTIDGFTPQARLRLPLGNGRVVLYGLAGAGISFLESNDRTAYGRRPDTPDFHAQHFGLSLAVSAGLEVFIAHNMAFGIETKLLHHDNHVSIDATRRGVTLDAFFVSGGLRLYFR